MGTYCCAHMTAVKLVRFEPIVNLLCSIIMLAINYGRTRDPTSSSPNVTKNTRFIVPGIISSPYCLMEADSFCLHASIVLPC